jgi:CHAT domain-containing protein
MNRFFTSVLCFLLVLTAAGQSQELASALNKYAEGLKQFGSYIDKIQAGSDAQHKRTFFGVNGFLSEKALANKLKQINRSRSLQSALLFYLFQPKHLEIYLIDETGLIAAQGIEIKPNQLLATETEFRTLLGVDNFTGQNSSYATRGAGVQGQPEIQNADPAPYIKFISDALFPVAIATKMKPYGHLYISASYNIATIPIGCLKPYANQYLIKNHAYTMIPNLADFLQKDYSVNYIPREANFLTRIYSGVIVGNPNYEQGNENLTEMFSDLPGALEQSYQVLELITDIGGDDLLYLSGDEATLSRVKKEATLAKDLLYFATHGVTSTTNTLDSSYLVFAADETSKSGWWTSRDIFRHNLKSKIAVLSACNTGSGGNTALVGQSSLASAFYFAGVDHVIATLWSVDDQWTKTIMTEVVRELNKPSDYYPAENIQRALQSYTNQELKYWAAFLSYGL